MNVCKRDTRVQSSWIKRPNKMFILEWWEKDEKKSSFLPWECNSSEFVLFIRLICTFEVTLDNIVEEEAEPRGFLWTKSIFSESGELKRPRWGDVKHFSWIEREEKKNMMKGNNEMKWIWMKGERWDWMKQCDEKEDKYRVKVNNIKITMKF